jgi:ComF family protein
MLIPAWARTGLSSQCEVCRQWSGSALCPDCEARFAPALPRCARCGLRTGVALAACGACLPDPPPFQRAVCAADYAYPWNALITAFKFNARPELARMLARLVTARLRALAAPLPALVVPVPSSPRRLAERGYNPAWELARHIASSLRLAADATVLQRPLENPPQASLDRASRQRNLAGSFMVDPRQRPRLQGLPVALVDDVMTTGATAREASSALLRAGASSVDLWVLARTPSA